MYPKERKQLKILEKLFALSIIVMMVLAGLFIFDRELHKEERMIQQKIDFVQKDLKWIQLVFYNVTVVIEAEGQEYENFSLFNFIDLENLTFGYDLHRDMYTIITVWSFPDWLSITDYDRLDMNLIFDSISIDYYQFSTDWTIYNGFICTKTFKIVDYTYTVDFESP